MQRLTQKVQQLIRAYMALQEENSELSRQLEKANNTLNALQQKNHLLEEKQATLALGSQTLSETDKQDLRRYIDTVVAEIDHILTTLHE